MANLGTNTEPSFLKGLETGIWQRVKETTSEHT
jgi:hypothetical protein